MNKFCIASLVVVSVALNAAAEFKMPKSVYRMDKLDDAKAEAESKGKAITFVYTTVNTSCGLCAGASLYAVNQLDRKTVVVYADSDTDWALLPKAVQEALRRPESGRYIPKTVIVDAGLTNVLAIVPYALGDEAVQLLKDAKKRLPEARLKSAVAMNTARLASASAFAVPPNETREMRTWLSKSRVVYKGSLVHVRNGIVVLKRADGSQVEVFESNLSEADQHYIQGIQKGVPNKLAAGNGR